MLFREMLHGHGSARCRRVERQRHGFQRGEVEAFGGKINIEANHLTLVIEVDDQAVGHLARCGAGRGLELDVEAVRLGVASLGAILEVTVEECVVDCFAVLQRDDPEDSRRAIPRVDDGAPAPDPTIGLGFPSNWRLQYPCTPCPLDIWAPRGVATAQTGRQPDRGLARWPRGVDRAGGHRAAARIAGCGRHVFLGERDHRNAEFETIPDQRRTASRCAASGKRPAITNHARVASRLIC
jgi:hypothetical protein